MEMSLQLFIQPSGGQLNLSNSQNPQMKAKQHMKSKEQVYLCEIILIKPFITAQSRPYN